MSEYEYFPGRRSWHEVTLQIGVNYVRRIVFLRVNHVDIDLTVEDAKFLVLGLEQVLAKLGSKLDDEPLPQIKIKGPVAGGHLSRLEKESKEKRILTLKGD